MKIHNQKEVQVITLVDEIFSDEKEERTFCTCGQCRLDVACYVLNRLEPRYVVSERGVAHTENPYQDRIQETADIAALIHEGIDRVSRTKRPDFPHNEESQLSAEEGALCAFPMIKGRVFNGTTFEPVCNIDVFLRVNGEVVEMVDPNWQNPCHIYENGSGSFFFLPKPAAAESSGLDTSLSFEVFVDDKRFETLHHFFMIAPVRNESADFTVHTSEGYSTEDLYLFEN
jgi:competence protein ComFB